MKLKKKPAKKIVKLAPAPKISKDYVTAIDRVTHGTKLAPLQQARTA
jgi:hypothetical protein